MNEPRTNPDPAVCVYSERTFLILLVLIGVAFGYALSCVLGGPVSDERFHGPQIWHYYHGGKDHYDNLTVPSTYHYIIGFLSRQIGLYHDCLSRFISLTIGLGLLPIFYFTVARYMPRQAPVRTLQLFFTPLIFPYFFLIYTDIWALLLIALCLYWSLRQYYILAALAGLSAVIIRQDSVIWVGLAYLLICFDGTTLSRPWPYKEILRNALVRGGPLFLVFIMFIAFVVYNGGVAVGDRDAHKISHFNITNLYVFLICAWLLFLALCIQQVPKIVALLRKPWAWFGLASGFLVYMGTFGNPHGYNNIMFSFFVHNGLLYLMNEYLWLRAALYIPIAWMAITLCVMEYPEKRFYWMLVIIPVAVICHPLVEPRYYFPAYVLINLWRPPLNMAAEIATLAIYIVLAAFIMYATATRLLFL